jgi:hypothetical protein
MNGNDEDQSDQPIRELANLESPVSQSFLQYFRRKIYRRTATAQLTNFSVSLPGAIFMEFLNIILHLFQVVDGKKGRSR